MRSHTWPRGRSLLCMSGFILEMPGVRFLPEKWGDAWFLSAAGRGVSEVRGGRDWEAPLRSGGLVHVRRGLPGWCAGSQSGSASDKLPTEVSCADGEAEQRGEERVAQHTCPHR